MKRLKVSSLLLAVTLLGMSMGFPHESDKDGSQTRKITYAGFMSCTARQMPALEQKQPIMPEVKVGEQHDEKQDTNLAGKIAGSSCDALLKGLMKKK
jgi:hypothetical protein